MKSKYNDKAAVNNVIGNIFKNPKLLDATDKYVFSEDDFIDEVQKIIFGSIYNLFLLGTKEITLTAIEDYLTQRPKKLAVYNTNKGSEFILKCAENSSPATFDYYYSRVKKMTLLRGYEQVAGMDLSWFYDTDNLFDTKKKQEQEDQFDRLSLEQIADLIDDKILSIRMKYVDDATENGVQAGDGIDELLAELKEKPELGYPLYGSFVNTVVRGARLKKFYLRSAATGVGKTRSMIADACYIGCGEMYKDGAWIQTGQPQPVLYIATEQDLEEIQTMMIAFLSGVNEEHIIYGEYLAGEWERVGRAAAILKRAQIYFEALPDFSLKDIENKIKFNIREHQIKYVFNP